MKGWVGRPHSAALPLTHLPRPHSTYHSQGDSLLTVQHSRTLCSHSMAAASASVSNTELYTHTHTHSAHHSQICCHPGPSCARQGERDNTRPPRSPLQQLAAYICCSSGALCARRNCCSQPLAALADTDTVRGQVCTHACMHTCVNMWMCACIYAHTLGGLCVVVVVAAASNQAQHPQQSTG